VRKGMLDRLAPDDQGGCSFHRAFITALNALKRWEEQLVQKGRPLHAELTSALQ